MSYCHKCGTKARLDDSFCEKCGVKIGEIVEEIEREAQQTIRAVQRKSHKGLIVLVILLVLVGYIALDIWAISQLTPLFTLSSVWASVSNFNFDSSLTKTEIGSTVRIKNPTFVPVLFGKISYDANYGTTEVAKGTTGYFILGPYAEKDIPVDLTISHTSTLWAGGKWIWNAITGKQERKYIDVYADFGITKFKIKTIG